MSSLQRTYAGCGGVAVIAAATLMPCHSVPIALSIGLGLSGASAVAAGLYGAIAAAVMCSVGVAAALNYNHKTIATISGVIGITSAALAWGQYAVPVRGEIIDAVKQADSFSRTVKIYESMCGQGWRPQ